MKKLQREYKFSYPEPFCMATVYPCKINRDNEDGTFSGHLDINNMSASKKIMALESIKYNDLVTQIAV